MLPNLLKPPAFSRELCWVGRVGGARSNLYPIDGPTARQKDRQKDIPDRLPYCLNVSTWRFMWETLYPGGKKEGVRTCEEGV